MNTFTISLKPLQLAYAALWLVPIGWGVGSEAALLPTEYIPNTASANYAVSLSSIVTAIGGVWLALRLPAFGFVRRRMSAMADMASRVALYKKCAWWRLAVIAVALWVNTVLYYAATGATSTKYCVLIAMIGALFCYPSVGECERLTDLPSSQSGAEGEETSKE